LHLAPIGYATSLILLHDLSKPHACWQGRRWIIQIKTHSNKKPLVMQAASQATAATWVKLLLEVQHTALISPSRNSCPSAACGAFVAECGSLTVCMIFLLAKTASNPCRCRTILNLPAQSPHQAVAAHEERMQKHDVFDRGLEDGVNRGDRNRAGCSAVEDSGTEDGVSGRKEGMAGGGAVVKEASAASAASVGPHKMARVVYGQGALGPKYMYVVVPHGQEVQDVLPGEQAEVVSQVDGTQV